MSGIIGLARSIAQDRRGATAIEYAFLAALIAVGIIGTVEAIGIQVEAPFTAVAGGFPTP